MTDKIVVLTTAGNLPEAKTIARRLVESRLAACVNVSAPVRSFYRWQGKIAEDREYLLVIKTRQDLFQRVGNAIREVHSYTTPEIVSLPVSEGSADYLRWIDDCVGTTVRRKSRPAPGRGRR